MNDTERALTLLWKVAGNTPRGCVALMQTLDDMMDNEDYDRNMIIDAHQLAFVRCQELQIIENDESWGGK